MPDIQQTKMVRTSFQSTNRKSQADLDRQHTYETFDNNPVTSKVGGGAASGTTGDTNVMAFGDTNFEYHIKGTQTITAPSVTSEGLDIGMDQTDNDGVEITQGILAGSRHAYTIGTDRAFFLRAKLKLPDVSGTDDCLIGFRKAADYQANVDDYTDMAALNVISGDIKIETILNNAATTTTDTTDNFADGETHELYIEVSATGVVTYKIDGVAPTVAAAFTFDSGDVIIPFLFYLQATTSPQNPILLEWECGFVGNEG